MCSLFDRLRVSDRSDHVEPLMVSLSNDERPARLVPLACAIAAAIGGAIVAWRYHRLGLTLTHYDARGHLVVARRIFDSITPGWQQIGAVWLPLPHLLNAIPVQIDLFYRTGASAVAISVVSFAIATGAIAWIVFAITESAAASVVAAAVFAINPNVLYLQATPMTEPLLLATITVAVTMLAAWTVAPLKGCPTNRIASVGIAFALACLTRYEAWPVTVSALVVAAWMRWRNGDAASKAWRDISAIAVYPVVAIAGFAVFSRVVGGQWFVGADFFVPENKALGDWWLAAKEIGWGIEHLSGEALTWIGAAGVAIAIGHSAKAGSLQRHAAARQLFVLPFLTMAVVPLGAFHQGHPFRIRYALPLIAVEAIGAGIVAAAIPNRRARTIAAAALLAVVAYELRPLDASAPMVAEARWDVPNLSERARVTACIGRLE